MLSAVAPGVSTRSSSRSPGLSSTLAVVVGHRTAVPVSPGSVGSSVGHSHLAPLTGVEPLLLVLHLSSHLSSVTSHRGSGVGELVHAATARNGFLHVAFTVAELVLLVGSSHVRGRLVLEDNEGKVAVLFGELVGGPFDLLDFAEAGKVGAQFIL